MSPSTGWVGTTTNWGCSLSGEGIISETTQVGKATEFPGISFMEEEGG